MMQVAWKYTRGLVASRKRRHGLLVLTTLLSIALMLWGIVRSWRDLRTYSWQLNIRAMTFSELAYLLALVLTIVAWTLVMRALQARSTWQQDAKFFFYSWMARRLPTPASH